MLTDTMLLSSRGHIQISNSQVLPCNMPLPYRDQSPPAPIPKQNDSRRGGTTGALVASIGAIVGAVGTIVTEGFPVGTGRIGLDVTRADNDGATDTTGLSPAGAGAGVMGRMHGGMARFTPQIIPFSRIALMQQSSSPPVRVFFRERWRGFSKRGRMKFTVKGQIQRGRIIGRKSKGGEGGDVFR